MRTTPRAVTGMKAAPRIPFYFMGKSARPYPCGRNRIGLCDGRNLANIKFDTETGKLHARFETPPSPAEFFLRPQESVDFEVEEGQEGPVLDLINQGLSNAYHQNQFKPAMVRLESALLKCEAWDQEYQDAWLEGQLPGTKSNQVPLPAGYGLLDYSRFFVRYCDSYQTKEEQICQDFCCALQSGKRSGLQHDGAADC